MLECEGFGFLEVNAVTQPEIFHTTSSSLFDVQWY